MGSRERAVGLLAWLGFAPCLLAFVFIRDQQACSPGTGLRRLDPWSEMPRLQRRRAVGCSMDSAMLSVPQMKAFCKPAEVQHADSGCRSMGNPWCGVPTGSLLAQVL